jgi:imidazoleglycerol phosphate synthase glutamine amidotransferase subunit HisH
MGNLASVLNAIKRVGGEAIVESEPNNLKVRFVR